ncbi:MAG: anaerobic ribonucleoside-triphosphate reductase activating protein [Clostridia bacterium]|nr:anaerobic ribonucleoside-triphosphate reductase activating protein [Clostridia bacterium]
MKIAGLRKLTLLDFPGRVACVVFTNGCNFRCPFCHNASLVLPRGEHEDISEEEFFAFLRKRKGILDGVVITGGEPTLANGLYEFIAAVKQEGYPVKLDTNGSFPDKLKPLLADGLLDYVAMDIKTLPEKYERVAGVSVDLDKLSESIDMIRKSGIPHEFRTTVVKGLHTKEDIVGIAKMLGEGEAYYLQGFVDSGDILAEGCEAFSDDEMHEMCEAAKVFCPRCELRGIE